MGMSGSPIVDPIRYSIPLAGDIAPHRMPPLFASTLLSTARRDAQGPRFCVFKWNVRFCS
ncbi:hypothetical protein M378DRAFT_168592 [Amanita muscaria Koide BX008]|uniref:Uncharacterized protein n=1 Tax=Amanita muscaria (strain Koide BX008) TaxID=946122 RepID=A0A0C2T0K3_AMAMK|nr:hypothetical protein M378DRAFT_168592 [Amanita muscaria Koide BX008]